MAAEIEDAITVKLGGGAGVAMTLIVSRNDLTRLGGMPRLQREGARGILPLLIDKRIPFDLTVTAK